MFFLSFFFFHTRELHSKDTYLHIGGFYLYIFLFVIRHLHPMSAEI